MIASVVKHDHRFLSPTNIFSIKVLYYLQQEQREGLTVRHSTIHSVPDFSSAAHSRNQVDSKSAGIASDLIFLKLRHPSSFPMISPFDNWLINVYNS